MTGFTNLPYVSCERKTFSATQVKETCLEVTIALLSYE
jgi:hypothetical protein